MATAEEYAAWIVANQAKRGTPEFETVAQAYQLAKGKTSKQESHDPTEGMTGTDKFLAGMGKAFYDVGRGAGQLVGMVDKKDVDEAKRLDAPLMKTGAGMAGNIAGNVAAAVPTAFLPGAASIPGAALSGAAFGALQPVGEGESRIQNTALGGALGGGSVAAGRALVAGVKGGKALVEPFTKKGQEAIVGRTLARFGGDQAPALTKGATDGFQPTLAQATQNPGFAVLEEAAQSADPIIKNAFVQRHLAQNEALMKALESVGGDKKALDMAKGVRSLMSEQLYKEAAQEGVDKGMAKAIAPQIKNIMERPSMIKAADKAKEIFGEESVALAKSGSVKGLQYMKQALDDMIETASGPTTSIGKNQLRALEQTRSDLISIIEEIAPKQRLADANYRFYSKPVNEMQAVQELTKKLRPALMEAAPGAPTRLTPNQFSTALRELDDNLPKLTGYPGATRENTMSAKGLKALEGVNKDLALRATTQDKTKGLNSITAQNLASQNLMRQMFGPLGMPNSWLESNVMPTILRPLNFAMKAQEPMIQQRMADVLLDPELAMMMMQANQNPYMPGLLMQGVTRSLPPAALGLLGYAE